MNVLKKKPISVYIKYIKSERKTHAMKRVILFLNVELSYLGKALSPTQLSNGTI